MDQVFDRDGDSAAHTSEVKLFSGVAPGDYVAQFEFYSAAGSGGSLVGQASASTSVGGDGTIDLNLTAATKVASVRVIPGQNVGWQAHQPLNFEVRDAGGAILAIDPKAVAWQSGDESALRFESGQAVGVMGGAGKPAANVTVTVDGVASPGAQVGVVPGAQVYHIQLGDYGRMPVVSALSEDGSTVMGRVTRGAGWQVATWRIGSSAPAAPVGPSDSTGAAISRDGSTVLYQIRGSGDDADRYFVTGPSGTDEVPLPDGAANLRGCSLSGDGLTVVGNAYSDGSSYYFRWTRTEGMKRLFQSGPFDGARASFQAAISSDGRVISGSMVNNSSRFVALSVDGNETIAATTDSIVVAVSDVAGGPKIVARSDKDSLLIANGTVTTLPLHFIGVGSSPADITPDGSVVVGTEAAGQFRPSHAVLWKDGAIQEFTDMLRDKAGYQTNPDRQLIQGMLGVSADKKTFLAGNYAIVLR